MTESLKADARGASSPEPDVDDPKAKARVEAFAVLLISLTAVLTAWTTFQSAKWAGEQTNAIARAEAARTEAESYYNDAREEYIVDVLLFNSWLDATLQGQAELADDYELRFSGTLDSAFQAWMAEDPFDDPDAPIDPFEEFDYPNDELGDELAEEADEDQLIALRNNQRSDNYVAMSIVFATVILFAALSDKLPGAQTRKILLTIATIGLLGGSAVVLTFPTVI